MARRGWAGLAVVVLLAGNVLPVAGSAMAADPDKPHPHRGVLVPYEVEPLDVVLDDEQRKDLAEGKLVHMTIKHEDKGGTGIGVIDIAAPVEIVWSRITGFGHYAEWIGPVKICEVYAQSGDTIRTYTKIKGFLYKYEYYLINVLYHELNLMLWTLDYDRKSDFDDCVGAWYVEPHPEKAGWSRAWFSSDLKLNSPIPGFLMKSVKKKGIKDAVTWVKRESELAVFALFE